METHFFDFFLNFSGPATYVIIFCFLLACGFGLPVPEDIVLVGAGLLSYYGNANVHMMFAVAMAGVLIGDSTVFFLGHKLGNEARKRKPFSKMLPDARFMELKDSFREKGNKVIFFGRFMPGLRAPIFFTAGSLHLPFRIFIFYNGLAALISVPAIVYSVWYFGDKLDHVVKIVKRVQFGIFGVILLVIGLLVLRYYLKKSKKII